MAEPAVPPSPIEKLTKLLPLLGLVTAVFYGVLWLSYARFYLPFGTTPDEVGIDKTDLLSNALVGPVVVFVLVTLVGLAILALTYLIALGQVILQDGKTTLARTNRVALLKLPSVKKVGLVILPLAFVGTALFLYGAARAASASVLDGESVTNVSLARVPVLSVRAVPVIVHWKGETVPKYFTEEDQRTGCLLYLGEANSMSVLYNSHYQELVRLASADAVLELRSDNLEASCHPE